MPPKDDESQAEKYAEIVQLMQKLNQEADFNTRLTACQKEIIIITEHYVKREALDEMIWDRIKTHQKNEDKIKAEGEKAEKKVSNNKIKWNVIIQGVIITVAAGIILAYLLNKGV